jgi:hypothetical protein
VTDDKHHDEQDDEGITAKLREGIRLPKSIAEKIAPACVWVVYAAAVWIVLHGIANAIKIARG